MKKLFVFLAGAAVALSATSCASLGGKNIDSLSYAVGADMGQSLVFGMKDFNLDNDIVVENIKSFYKDGDILGEDIKAVREKMMEFQYTLLMPYMNAKRMNDFVKTDCPDTLPALPELYNETFTRELVSEMMGKNMGAAIKSLQEEVNMRDVLRAIDDVKTLNGPEEADSLLRMTGEQIRNTFTQYSQRMQAKAQAEREKAMAENAEASAKWLAEVETMEGVKKTESGILYRIDREGSEVMATEDTDVVLVNYEGKTSDGEVFDSSYERGEPISFPLNRVIKGWTEGMKLVGVGGQITLWIPSELAYGERGAGANIGPNQALEFKVELLEVNPTEE
ncbi:MAG: FKBP-type peptidyl-prolyl cis-trans isomerase [Alistipes sp.]|nr:FKBP-type peptidyl-prolyl cis-trans isomerase [Alistipes sp.]